jgi:hypothetical protein
MCRHHVSASCVGHYELKYLVIQYPMQKIKVTHATVTKTIITPIGAFILYYLYVIFLFNTTMFITLHYGIMPM